MCEDGARDVRGGGVDGGLVGGGGGGWEGYKCVVCAGPEGLDAEEEFGAEVVVMVDNC